MTDTLRLFLVLFLITTENNALYCPNQKSIEQSLAESNIPGAVIVVVNATDVLYEQAFGYQSILPQVSMNVDKSIFTIASISKTFIAVAVMQLVEKQLIDLDTDINQYLSEPDRKIFHPHYPSHSITLRKLLSHSASIAVNTQGWINFYRPGDSAFMETTLADICFTYINPNTSNRLPEPPGSVTYYSNEGSALAALVVERMTKMPYDQYVLKNIFKPLNIDITKMGVHLADFENQEDLVRHYTYASNASYLPVWKQLLPQFNLTPLSATFPTWIEFPFFSIIGYPAGLWGMSARSLSIFLRMIMSQGSTIVTRQSIAAMRTIVGGGRIPYHQKKPSKNAKELLQEPHFGLCWYWETTSKGVRYMGHSGTLLGMKHLILINEKNTVGVIVLTNGDNRQTIYLSRENLGTITNIHMSLFQCFESNANKSISFRRDGRLLGYFYTVMCVCLALLINK
ncbi:unnamed protein product [Rotaria socialis]|uniref:Beta-lactamase-related domain-containing protein n=1 Tax=Rotaria socialis TaxID=392032 RepID=A0A818UBE5_9BILA|nr:unnamed protein product [Rotaria socialis]CAF4750767.1 unnamed protein product [Rotaria socialis]